MTPIQLNRLFQLLGALRESIITDAEFAELSQILKTDPESQNYYIEYMYLCADLCNLQAATNHNDSVWNAMKSTEGHDSPLSLEAFQILGDYEKQADKVEISSEQDSVNAGESEHAQHPTRRISRPLFSILITATAALFFLLAYINLYPKTSQEVATLADSINAEWTSWLPLERETRITVTQEPIRLQRGVIKLVTDENVHIIIESPAKFRFLSNSQLIMDEGRLFATVSQTGRGFTVQTGNSKITDLGTEFGVSADSRGTTELHVFKGETVFIGETKNQVKSVLNTVAGQALRLEPSYGEIKRIALNDTKFIRSIDSQAHLLWRGQKKINLADIIGDGDGFNSGKCNYGLNPLTGKFGVLEARDRKASNNYTRIADSVFIDGVFVPNGNTEQIVSTVGHIFEECPVTKGCFYTGVLNTPTAPDDSPLLLNGKNYNDPHNSCVYLHANIGVTFDLDAFRSRLHGVKLSQFNCTAGICDSAPLGFFNADIYVLVDGQVRYQKRQIKTHGGEGITIELQDKDRFLTLVSTDGGDEWKPTEKETRPRSSTGHDWVIFDEPTLNLE